MSNTTLRRLRIATLAGGALLLLSAMAAGPEQRWPRDLLWALGVAALILTLVVNRLLRRQDGAADRKPEELD